MKDMRQRWPTHLVAGQSCIEEVPITKQRGHVAIT